METIFPDGFRMYKPSDKAPEFIKANVEVNVHDFLAFCDKHRRPDGTVRFVVKESKEKKALYMALDTYERPARVESQEQSEEDVPLIPF